MNKPRIGQRWKWQYPKHEFIVEILNDDGHFIVIQVIGSGCNRGLGEIGNHSLTSSDWIYLEGQDKSILDLPSEQGCVTIADRHSQSCTTVSI